MLSSPLLETLSRLRIPVATRELTPAEKTALSSQGNRFDRVHVLAGPGFDASEIWHCRFVGQVVLSGTVMHSTLEDVVLGQDVSVSHCPLIRRSIIGDRATVRGSSLDCTGETSFGIGTVIKAGLETAGKEVVIWDALTLDDALRYLKEPVFRAQVAAVTNSVRFDRSVVGSGARIINAGLADRVFLGEGCIVEGAAWIEASAVMSSADEPTRVGPGVQLRHSIVQWGAELDSSAQVSRSILMEYSGAEQRATVNESLIGPNTRVGLGEITASLVGPFVGFHHQSLLIAAWWPEGRGNVGSGASIGSNHTSRSPDQELHAGEGTFFGLACAVKYPANFDDAPYSIIASGIIVPPQKLSLPFSLMTDGEDGNRVIPGWVYRENTYQLLRSEAKFLQRNKARRHTFDLRIFRPDLVDKLWRAREILESIQGKPVYDGHDLPALGKNRLLEADRIAGIEAYSAALRYAALRLHADSRLRGIACDTKWLDEQFEKLGIAGMTGRQRLNEWLDEERRLWKSALAAKRRDDARGAAVIPDYGDFHVPATDDAFLSERATELGALERKIQDIYRSKA
jgi:NDP-sugar pyrophosphorylase family protein